MTLRPSTRIRVVDITEWRLLALYVKEGDFGKLNNADRATEMKRGSRG